MPCSATAQVVFATLYFVSSRYIMPEIREVINKRGLDFINQRKVTHRRPPTISTKPYNASLVFEAVTRPPCNKYKTSSRKSRAWAPLSNKYERLKHNPRALERWKIPHRRSESSLNPKSILFLVGLRRTVILNISFCCYIILQPR